MAGGYFTHAEAATWLYDLLDSVIEVTDPEGKFMFESIFNVKPMKRPQEINFRIGGFGLPEERAILQDMTYDKPVMGEKQTVSPLEYGKAFKVAREMIRDLADAGPNDSENEARLISWSEYTRRLKHNGFLLADIECARKLVNCTSTAAAYVGRDGVALCASNQTTLDNPPLTQSNISTNASLTAPNLMTAITALDTQRDDRGEYFSDANEVALIVPPSLSWKAIEITKTTGEVGTANNTVNALKNRPGLKITPYVWKNLNRANGAEYTGWFVASIGKEGARGHGLQFRWREKPNFQKGDDFDANAVKYKMNMSMVNFHEYWQGFFGHPPS